MIRLRTILQEITSGQFRAEVFSKIEQIAAEMGESSPRYIGSGWYGQAFQCASGRVLKITADSAEVTTALRRRVAVPHLISYYDIRVVRSEESSTRDDTNTIFALLMDAVTPLTETQRKIWDFLGDSGYFRKHYDAATFRAQCDHRMRDESGAVLSKYLFVKEDAEFFHACVTQRDKILAAVSRYNIDSSEAHSSNVGLDSSGRVTIFDMQTRPSNMRFDASAVKMNRTYSELASRVKQITI